MRELSETATTLTIHHPWWLGISCLVVAYALSYWFIKTARKTKSPIAQVAAGIGGIIVGTIVGFGALTDHVALDAKGARESRLLYQSSASWQEVVEVTVEDRRSRRSMNPHLVLKKKTYGEMAAEISGLGPDEIELVLAFARKRAAGR